MRKFTGLYPQMYKSYKFYKSILICISEWILPPEGWFCQKWSHLVSINFSSGNYLCCDCDIFKLLNGECPNSNNGCSKMSPNEETLLQCFPSSRSISQFIINAAISPKPKELQARYTHFWNQQVFLYLYVWLLSHHMIVTLKVI